MLLNTINNRCCIVRLLIIVDVLQLSKSLCYLGSTITYYKEKHPFTCNLLKSLTKCKNDIQFDIKIGNQMVMLSLEEHAALWLLALKDQNSKRNPRAEPELKTRPKCPYTIVNNKWIMTFSELKPHGSIVTLYSS